MMFDCKPSDCLLRAQRDHLRIGCQGLHILMLTMLECLTGTLSLHRSLSTGKQWRLSGGTV